MTFRTFALVGVAVLTLAAGLAQAQTATDPYRDQRALPSGDAGDPKVQETLLRARGEAYHRAPDEAQNPDEVRTTQALNAEITAQNDLAETSDASARLDYEAAMERYRIEVRQGEEKAQAQAEAARAAQDEAERQYRRDYDAWRERVRLCQSGVRSACAQP